MSSINSFLCSSLPWCSVSVAYTLRCVRSHLSRGAGVFVFQISQYGDTQSRSMALRALPSRADVRYAEGGHMRLCPQPSGGITSARDSAKLQGGMAWRRRPLLRPEYAAGAAESHQGVLEHHARVRETGMGKVLAMVSHGPGLVSPSGVWVGLRYLARPRHDETGAEAVWGPLRVGEAADGRHRYMGAVAGAQGCAEGHGSSTYPWRWSQCRSSARYPRRWLPNWSHRMARWWAEWWADRRIQCMSCLRQCAVSLFCELSCVIFQYLPEHKGWCADICTDLGIYLVIDLVTYSFIYPIIFLLVLI